MFGDKDWKFDWLIEQFERVFTSLLNDPLRGEDVWCPFVQESVCIKKMIAKMILIDRRMGSIRQPHSL